MLYIPFCRSCVTNKVFEKRSVILGCVRTSSGRPFFGFIFYMSEYPTSDELLTCLSHLAGASTAEGRKPFRVDLIRTHGKPPMYSVMIKAAEKDLLRMRIGQIITRQFALGATSFMLTGSEAQSLIAGEQASVA